MWDEGMQISLLWPQPVPLNSTNPCWWNWAGGLKGDFEGELANAIAGRLWQIFAGWLSETDCLIGQQNCVAR